MIQIAGGKKLTDKEIFCCCCYNITEEALWCYSDAPTFNCCERLSFRGNAVLLQAQYVF